MSESAYHLDELLASRASQSVRRVDPSTIVIFGASGDLTARKLIPALYHLAVEKALPSPYRIIGYARREKTDESFRQELREALAQFSRTKPVNDEIWNAFAQNICYCQADISDPAGYEKLKQMILNPASKSKFLSVGERGRFEVVSVGGEKAGRHPRRQPVNEGIPLHALNGIFAEFRVGARSSSLSGGYTFVAPNCEQQKSSPEGTLIP